MKISTQIALSYFLIVGLASYFFLSVFVEDIKPGVTQSVEETLVDTANILAELAAPDLVSGKIGDGAFAKAVRAYGARSVDAPISGLHKTSLDYRVLVTDARGIVVYDSAGEDLGADFSRWNDVYLSLRGRYGARSTATDPKDRHSAVMHVAAPILDQGQIVGVLTVAKADATIAPFIDRAETHVRIQGALLLTAAAGIGLFFAWRLTRSINRLRRYARLVSSDSHVALPRTMNREIAELGVALEGMRERLDGKLYVEQYVHALAHEIKSPVAAIKAAGELIGEDLPAPDRARFSRTIQDEAERIGVIVERLLELARLEHLQALQSHVAIDLEALLQKVLADLGHRQAGKRLVATVAGSILPIEGEPFLIEEALRNLIENAIDFSPEGGAIAITLSNLGPFAVIRIDDEGPGIPDYAKARIFERFYSLPRPDTGKKSTGLGLSLVNEVAKLHGGSIRIGNRAGAGASAELRLRHHPDSGSSS